MSGHPPSGRDDAKREAIVHALNEKDERHPHVNRTLILVVDERPDICDMLQQALTLAGYRVTAYAGGEGWIDRAMQSDDPPALVLLDLSNPSRGATAFLQDLRTGWQAAPPILVMTTSRDIHDELAARERVVLKPFHIHDLLVVVQKIIHAM